MVVTTDAAMVMDFGEGFELSREHWISRPEGRWPTNLGGKPLLCWPHCDQRDAVSLSDFWQAARSPGLVRLVVGTNSTTP